jgi:chaperonin cofactor prefoldin
MDSDDVRLLAEQLSHTVDLLNARIATLEAAQTHADELVRLRLSALERSQEDQETRLRTVADAVARLSTSTSLAQVGQAALAVILSAIAAYLGRR